tara:strand:- start:3997 stop:4317 length:321 start_codon:yes stop_codon:yes gene_type:complete
MKTYFNGPRKMSYGGGTRKPMMYGGGIKRGIASFEKKSRKKKQMGGMNMQMSSPMPMQSRMNQMQPQMMAKGSEKKVKKKKPFPDLTGDGKVTFADVLKGRGVDKA